jgi:uncharacterized protein YndB with AHSA1/START domain
MTLLYIVAAIVVVIAAVLLFAASQPGTMECARSTAVQAPPEKIFPLINDFHQWAAWSPYEARDLAMKKTYSGAPSGPGAVYEWTGNREVGQGRMEITSTSAPNRVEIKLHFLKPFEGRNVSEFTMMPAGGSTTVTWRMTGPRPFMMKVMGLFMNMDKLLGGDFEKGLANIKRIAEQ